VIICGTDLSAASEGALAVASALAVQRGDPEVVLVHVVDDQAAADGAKRKLDAQAAIVERPTVRVELVIGHAHETLAGLAHAEGADLIVIAAASSPGKSLISLGSTAEQVIFVTRTPVLVVRDPAPWLAFARGERPLKVLLGIDDSVASDLGIQWTYGLRERGAVDVVVGAVYYPDDAAEHYGLHAKALVDRDPEIEVLLSRDLIKRFGTAERVVARPKCGLGRIGDHVVELARDEQVDAIVVGTTQKTGLGRLGSVSTVVVHDAPQSVVCVPPTASLPTLRVPPIKSALVATDLSPFANRAVPYAFAAVAPGGDIHIVHVVPQDADVDPEQLGRTLVALAPPSAGAEVTAHVIAARTPRSRSRRPPRGSAST
jgi:nucleotide-binding universal stress UspA family protein